MRNGARTTASESSDVTVSNFLTDTIERFLDQVVDQADTDPVKHMRLAALQRSRPLLGEELMASWRARAGGYPDELVSAMVERALNPRMLGSLGGTRTRSSPGATISRSRPC